jgi:RNA polymerase sigma-70 factor (ECF subfamily)
MVDPSRQRTLRLVSSTEKAEVLSVSDDELIDDLVRGNSGSGERLYDHLIGAVESTLYRILGTRGPDHEDLVQSAFEQIVVTLTQGRFTRTCSLKSWAVVITNHLALNTVRARTNERKVFNLHADADTSESATWRSDPERDSSARRDLSMLRKLLAQMSPKLAQTLVLHDAFGHDLAEIATLTGASIAAAQSRLVRGRRTLEELLAKSGLREES